MENRKFIILFSLVLGMTFSSQAFAYEVGTHAYLTSDITNFYNKNFSENKISDELKAYLIDGSRREDDIPRWMNHFYDPVNNRGLSYDAAIDPAVNLGTWEESKKWAGDENNQNKLTYKVPATIASILTAFEQNKLSDISSETDFTWQKAIEYWIKGDKEKAMFALGHILHLIEDVSVPDHTRNDPHPNDSPYEKWTSKFTLENPDGDLAGRLSNKKPLVLDNLNSYFDGLATYSNNNFYSKDTIGIQSGYKSPEPDNIWQEDKLFYGFKKDDNGNYYHLISYKNNPKDIVWAIKDNLDLVDKQGDRVMNDYWSRLSVKSVQYSAGVIDLFFKEVEKYKNDQSFLKEEPKFFGAQVVSMFKDLLNKLFGNGNGVSNNKLTLVSEISLDKKDATAQNTADVGNSGSLEPSDLDIKNQQNNLNTSDTQNEDAADAAKLKPTTDSNLNFIPQVSKPIQVCTFNTSKTANYQNLLINEVAWMGGPVSANDEWIELKNISGGELDISGWQVLDKDENIKITFPQNKKMPAGGFLLLERTDDNSLPGIKADVIYSGALSNTNEGLRLFNNECNLVDEVTANSDWPAGIAEARRTMERQANLSWNTYGGNGENFGGVNIMGTPRKENGSIVFLPSGSIQPVSNQVAVVVAQPAPSTPAKILISEIQITGGTGKSNNDFIELYNPNNFQVNLNGYRLVKRTKTGTTDSSIKSWTSDALIPAKGYYLWANNDYSDIAATPDIRTSTTLADDNGVAIRFGAEDIGTIIDGVGWGLAANNFVEIAVFGENPIANQSISRQSENDTNNNSVDFVKSKPTPKNSSVGGGFLAPELWNSSQTAIQTSHIVISEIYPDRTGANQDFIELYNPNPPGIADADISGWSLQILSANATTTDKISKKNFETGNKIPTQGFFLIGMDKYPAADMNWASGSLNSSDGATIFLVSGTSTITDFEDSRIIDQIAYGGGDGITVPETTALALPESGKSWERKTYSSGNCVFSQALGEYLGNGCDRDDNSNDFELREIPKPQKLANLMEPRNAPAALQNFSANYSTSTLNVVLNWNESSDYLGATSTLDYFISYATSTLNAMRDLAMVKATTTYQFKINEVGLIYKFNIVAKDRDGLASETSSAELTVDSPLTNLYFYKDTRAIDSKKYLLDFYYDNYPFVPNVYNRGSGSVLVFYLNKEAPAEIELNTANNFQPQNPDGRVKDGVVGVVYPRCAGDGPNSVGSPSFSLILPGSCGNGGGVENSTLVSAKLEDPHLLFELAKTADEVNFTNQDFVTVGMYSFADSGGGSQRYRLSAMDRNKYYFQDEVLAHQRPVLEGELSFEFNSGRSILELNWEKATDSDSLDNYLTYEINYSVTGQFESENWEAIGAEERAIKQVSPGNSFLIGVRAKDDFGDYSEIKTIEWSYPETTFSITQDQFNGWSRTFGDRNPNGGSSSASLQSIRPVEDIQFNVVSLRLKQEMVSDSADVQLSVYADKSGVPDFDSKIAESILSGIIRPDSDSDIAFTFSSEGGSASGGNVSLSADNTYWLVLGIKNYGDSRGFYRNQWSNAINSGTDVYAGGQGGFGPIDNYVNSYSPSIIIPYPDASADWYFKIGLLSFQL